MSKNKKGLSLLLAGTMALSMAGCGEKPVESVQPTQVAELADGTYTATAAGVVGELKVEVTFAGGAISAVKVAEHNETADLGGVAAERIPAAIVENQSVLVDGMSGATITSDAIKTAVKDCIEQAGGNVADFEKEVTAAPKDAMEKEADIAIVGAGGAGLLAAVTASRAGASVIVLEKASNAYSSNFATCGGPAGAETKVMAEVGCTTTNQQMYDHLYDYSNTTVDALALKECVTRAGQAIDLMYDMGIEFSLNEDTYGVGYRARHSIQGKGAARIDPLTSEVEANGGEFLYETTGEEIIMENGKAVGVRGTAADGTPVTVNAKAVLVCTGGFQGSEEMLHQIFGDVNVVSLGSNLSTGDGINMVLEAGGTLDRNFGVLGNEFAGANSKLEGSTFDRSSGFNLSNENMAFWIFGGLTVDMDGDRFINEKLVADFPLALGGEAILRQGKVYTVMDEAYYNACSTEGIVSYLGDPADWKSSVALRFGTTTKAPEQLQSAIDQGWAYKADTLADAAAYFGLENLEKTVAEYNEMCANGEDTLFGKSANFMTAIGEGPYYVFEYEPSAWSTFGGVKTDSYLRAVGAGGDYIPGLYVGGVDTGSYYAVPYYDGPGTCVGLAIGSGIYAAENMLEYIGK